MLRIVLLAAGLLCVQAGFDSINKDVLVKSCDRTVDMTTQLAPSSVEIVIIASLSVMAGMLTTWNGVGLGKRIGDQFTNMSNYHKAKHLAHLNYLFQSKLIEKLSLE